MSMSVLGRAGQAEGGAGRRRAGLLVDAGLRRRRAGRVVPGCARRIAFGSERAMQACAGRYTRDAALRVHAAHATPGSRGGTCCL